jgi:DNA-directed RNA polymerase subunit M/transcription elongation factor TFIIS
MADQLHFCSQCESLSFPEVDGKNDRVVYQCRTCLHQDVAPDTARCLLQRYSVQATEDSLFKDIIERTPSLSTTNLVKASPCGSCGLDYCAQLVIGDNQVKHVCSCGNERSLA